MQTKQKVCRAPSCKNKFSPWSSLQVVCSPKCAREYAKVRAGQRYAKQIRAQEKREALEKIETLSELKEKCQRVFNQYIRLRDKNDPCISCLKEPTSKSLLTGSEWDCGHFRSIAACPELRYSPINAHKQCVYCNKHLSGNHTPYRHNLIAKIGIKAVEWIEGKHEPKNYSKEELRFLIKRYRKLIKKLRR